MPAPDINHPGQADLVDLLIPFINWLSKLTVDVLHTGKVTASIFRFNDRKRFLERDPNSFL
ncbi:hypothetical protein GCM10027085_29850 [Spirosoma aerophilum]